MPVSFALQGKACACIRMYVQTRTELPIELPNVDFCLNYDDEKS